MSFIDARQAKNTAEEKHTTKRDEKATNAREAVARDIQDAVNAGHQQTTVRCREGDGYMYATVRLYPRPLFKTIVRELVACGYEARVTWLGNLKISWKNAKEGIIQPQDVERKLKEKK
jgi:hypothetical protein